MPRPKVIPLPDLSGEDVFLIGGGASLKSFDFDRLKPLNTIGCNQAFKLGSEICHICTFGDFKFWQTYEKELAETYGGWVVSNYTTPTTPPWLKFYHRQQEGLGKGNILGWNFNTGAMAINLALVLGAARVFLLGFDLKPTGDRTHWHNYTMAVIRDTHYARFKEGFGYVRRDLPKMFPNRVVLNVTDGASALKVFPTIRMEDVDFSPR